MKSEVAEAEERMETMKSAVIQAHADMQERIGAAQAEVEKERELRQQSEMNAQEQIRQLEDALAQHSGAAGGGGSGGDSPAVSAALLKRVTILRSEVELAAAVRQGGTATLRLGSWRGLPVAVKEFHEPLRSAYNKKIWERELSRLAGCIHPNLVAFYGAVLEPLAQQPCLVMELMVCSWRESLQAGIQVFILKKSKKKNTHKLSFGNEGGK
jgi:hypothetical protein